MVRPLEIMVRRSAPITLPAILPSPPDIAVPPSTTAVNVSIIIFDARFGWPVASRLVRIIPAKLAHTLQNTKYRSLYLITEIPASIATSAFPPIASTYHPNKNYNNKNTIKNSIKRLYKFVFYSFSNKNPLIGIKTIHIVLYVFVKFFTFEPNYQDLSFIPYQISQNNEKTSTFTRPVVRIKHSIRTRRERHLFPLWQNT